MIYFELYILEIYLDPGETPYFIDFAKVLLEFDKTT